MNGKLAVQSKNGHGRPMPGPRPLPVGVATAARESPVDMADPADILAKMGYDWGRRVVINSDSCDPWFRMMADTTGLSDEELGNQDIGSLNLKAAVGLPGAETMSVDACVQTLNAWSGRVRAFTDEHLKQFEESPEKFDGSLARFRMASLAFVLQKHIGVRYNLGSADGHYDATDSRRLFIHGLLSGRCGTRATLPVLFLAVGAQTSVSPETCPSKTTSLCPMGGSGRRTVQHRVYRRRPGTTR